MFEFNIKNIKEDFLEYEQLVWNLDTDNSNV
jgi:hypothetical protein